MKYLITNFFFTDNSILENFLDQTMMKEMPFNAKVKNKLPDKKKDLNYFYVLIPVQKSQAEEKVKIIEEMIFHNISSSIGFNEDYLYSLAKLFEEADRSLLEKIPMQLTVLGVIDESEINITYTDGSFKKDTKQASYGVVKLLEENEEGIIDDFTGKKFLYKDFSDVVEDGTNNVGELNGLKVAIENFGDKKYQLIVSDSEYSIKALREWYYGWEKNNFKNYAKKSVMNKELIQEIYEKAKTSGKIIFFKWVKGHSKNSFNEFCDRLAKSALEIL